MRRASALLLVATHLVAASLPCQPAAGAPAAERAAAAKMEMSGHAHGHAHSGERGHHEGDAEPRLVWKRPCPCGCAGAPPAAAGASARLAASVPPASFEPLPRALVASAPPASVRPVAARPDVIDHVPRPPIPV